MGQKSNQELQDMIAALSRRVAVLESFVASVHDAALDVEVGADDGGQSEPAV